MVIHDALAEHDSARSVMSGPALRVIAHEAVTSLKGNVSVNWTNRDLARAKIRVRVKDILRRPGYPPDLPDAAVQNVLRQVEALEAERPVV